MHDPTLGRPEASRPSGPGPVPPGPVPPDMTRTVQDMTRTVEDDRAPDQAATVQEPWPHPATGAAGARPGVTDVVYGRADPADRGDFGPLVAVVGAVVGFVGNQCAIGLAVLLRWVGSLLGVTGPLVAGIAYVPGAVLLVGALVVVYTGRGRTSRGLAVGLALGIAGAVLVPFTDFVALADPFDAVGLPTWSDLVGGAPAVPGWLTGWWPRSWAEVPGAGLVEGTVRWATGWFG